MMTGAAKKYPNGVPSSSPGLPRSNAERLPWVADPNQRSTPKGNAVRDFMLGIWGFLKSRNVKESQIPPNTQLDTIQSERNLAHVSRNIVD